jgi:predicted nucleic acid-binding protein
VLVVDASVVIAALTDAGATGEWAQRLLTSDELVAPHHMPAEAVNALRRTLLAGQLSSDEAAAAHVDILRLNVELFPYWPLADRVWELRGNLTPYDGWYVALAESLGASVATLDRALTRAPGTRCGFVTPPL